MSQSGLFCGEIMPSARTRALRTVAGFVVAPMMPALILAAVVLVTGGDSQTLGYAAFASYVSYPFALLVGLPAFLVMRRRRWDGWRAYAAAGFVLGLVFVGLFTALVGVDGEKANSVWVSLLANLAFLLPFVLACALASSMVFWLVVRPDLSRA
jgi:cation transporter-like permease